MCNSEVVPKFSPSQRCETGRLWSKMRGTKRCCAVLQAPWEEIKPYLTLPIRSAGFAVKAFWPQKPCVNRAASQAPRESTQAPPIANI